jgi:flagellar M-ring protein FliF
VALVIVFALIRPAMKAAMTPPPTAAADEDNKGTQLDAVVDDEEGLPALAADGSTPALEAPKVNEKLEAARNLARTNPAAVANIMRELGQPANPPPDRENIRWQPPWTKSASKTRPSC